jgi:tRNA A58 N-methylase Trm61
MSTNNRPTSFGLNIAPLNVNGVIHVGAGAGQMAEYYHKLGVHKVMWLEKNNHNYSTIYANVIKFGMKQKVTEVEIANETVESSNKKRFVDLWRETAAHMQLETYDMITVDCRDNQLDILKSFEFLLDDFRVIAFTCPSGFKTEEETEIYLKGKMFNLVVFNSTERLYVKHGINF